MLWFADTGREKNLRRNFFWGISGQMGSLALFELEETLGQTGDTVIIQMHEIDQKNCLGCLELRLERR